jgi:hypothetical protein
LTDCLDSYVRLQADLPATLPAANAGASLLDQISPIDLTVRGHALVELLRPAYLAFANPADIHQPPETAHARRHKPTTKA